ncbi:diaminopimelate epimerase [Synergistales bacterium]|nr:diaminopimelate epimerase [Synergistales bacterium]
MKLDFTKVNGNGNDFIVLKNMDGTLTTEDLSRLAQRLCRRRFSIGADGILAVEKSDTADFAMRIFNSDGSEAEMCGNGARAIARYAFEKKIAGESMSFTTGAGLIKAVVEPPYAELDMGTVDVSSATIGDFASALGIISDKIFTYVFTTVGVPHCVVFVDDYDAMSVSDQISIGRDLSHDYGRFPQGANVSFAEILLDEDDEYGEIKEIKAVTYERGVEDLTESCGTGCVAIAIAYALVLGEACATSLTRVINPGGVNEVRLSFEGARYSCRAWLKGKTTIVADGQISEEALS